MPSKKETPPSEPMSVTRKRAQPEERVRDLGAEIADIPNKEDLSLDEIEKKLKPPLGRDTSGFRK
jgi:hypothetical protein